MEVGRRRLVLGTGTAAAVAIAGPLDQPAPKAGAGVNRRVAATPPPGYFNFPPRDKKDGTPPLPILKDGQTIAIEVLEALPGRPITGERIIRPGGMVSLGFYGDLAVAGLNRTEAKIRVVEAPPPVPHRRHARPDPGRGGAGLVDPPADTNCVFVADGLDAPRLYASQDRDYQGLAKPGQSIQIEVLEALPGRPISGQFAVGPDGSINLFYYGDVQVGGLTRDQIKVKVIEQLRKQLSDKVLGLVTTDEQGNLKAVPAVESQRVFVDDLVPAPAPRTSDEVRQLRGKVDNLETKLDRVLGELEKIRSHMAPAKP